MFLNDGWKDYEILDASEGRKLERFGEYILSRPDPQIIWKSDRKAPWNKANAVYNRSSSGGGSWDIKSLPEVWTINYKRLTFNLKPMSFKHTGVFPEQAVNWDFIYDTVKAAGRPVKVLNLFAYTGAATLAAAAAGAEVCHVDAAKGMVAWAKENAVSSGLREAPVRYIVDDCVKFVEKEIRRGKKYDAVILDPPSYGRGPSGEVWKLEDMLFDFLTLLKGVISDDPLFVLLNSYTTGLSSETMKTTLLSAFAPEFYGNCEAGELLLPIKNSPLCLPCGATARFLLKRK